MDLNVWYMPHDYSTYTLHETAISRHEADVIGTALQEYNLPLQLVDWNLGTLSYT